MLLNFLYHTKNFHKFVIALLIFTLLSSMAIVTEHAFMYEQMGSSKSDHSMVSIVKDSQTGHAMLGEDCQCPPSQCQSITAQVDVAADGLSVMQIILDGISPISYKQSTYKPTELEGLISANANLNTTHPPINIRYQSFLI